MKQSLVIGTRSSPLALWQAEFVKAELEAAHPSLTVTLRHIKTTGDKVLDSPLSQLGSQLGDKGIFTREIEKELLSGTIDLAVHSLKDLPTALPDGLVIAAVTKREDVRDVLIAKSAPNTKPVSIETLPVSIETLPLNARVATSSLRRRSQLLALRPDLMIVDIRGNVGTRIKKIDDSTEVDALVLAYAGVHRLGFDARISEVIALEKILPAVGQGALGIETRKSDTEVRELVQVLSDAETELCAVAERSLLRKLEGGCQIPVGANARIEKGLLRLSAVVGSLDGKELVRDYLQAFSVTERAQAQDVGIELAERLISAGGKRILDSIRAAVRNTSVA